MGEKVINAKPGKPREFVIPAFKGSKNQRNVTLILPDEEDPNRYVIVKKNIPKKAWSKGKSKEITWINNFGVKLQGKFVEKIDYQVVVDALPAGKSYFFFDGENVQSFAAADVDSSGSTFAGRWVLSMHSGDPAVGMGGSGR
jgi:hypothetical protein